MTVFTEPNLKRIPESELAAIVQRWRSNPNSDGAALWYARDVGALLNEVLLLRVLFSESQDQFARLTAEAERLRVTDSRRRGVSSTGPAS
jgi:hypothetical protein